MDSDQVAEHSTESCVVREDIGDMTEGVLPEGYVT